MSTPLSKGEHSKTISEHTTRLGEGCNLERYLQYLSAVREPRNQTGTEMQVTSLLRTTINKRPSTNHVSRTNKWSEFRASSLVSLVLNPWSVNKPES